MWIVCKWRYKYANNTIQCIHVYLTHFYQILFIADCKIILDILNEWKKKSIKENVSRAKDKQMKKKIGIIVGNNSNDN